METCWSYPSVVVGQSAVTPPEDAEAIEFQSMDLYMNRTMVVGHFG